jgi:multidrug efflux pump subunit AcrA (membrane-fusion protein)
MYMTKMVLYFLLVVVVVSCGQQQAAETDGADAPVITPVTVTGVNTGPMAQYIELNATSSFLQKSVIKASANGYLQTVNIIVGKTVSAGSELFILKTKEAQSIGNTINSLDSTLKFSGLITIRAAKSGHISEVNHQKGDYVQDGEQLAVINDVNSFVFVLNLPYELRPYVLGKRNVQLKLPDGQSLNGTITEVTAVVDSSSQTQNVFIKVNQQHVQLPVNLVAKVTIEQIAKPNAISLPKPAVLSDETQTSFWVMQVIDSTTAVKVPVKKGLETNDQVEIVSPKFSPTDQFLLTGNYGLPDTAKIKIVKQ